MKRSLRMTVQHMFGSRFRAGTYASFAAALVIAIAIVVNLLVSSLPSTQTQLDMTSSNLYSLSDQTRQILSTLDKDVDLYLLATTGYEDSTICRLLDRYSALSSHVKVTYMDPTVNPTFLKGYDLSTSNLYANSVLVDCAGNYRLVGYDEIYETSYSMNYYSYSYDTTTSFNGEGALTSAIHYVSSDDLPKVYALTGHGETELASSFTELMTKDNMTMDKLSLVSADAVPEDATTVLINAPQSDISEDEAQMLIDYLSAGGSVVLMTDYIEDGKMTNLLRVTETMGLTTESGIVIEGDRNYRLNRYPHYLLPEVASHDITDAVTQAGYVLLVPVAQPLKETGASSAAVTMLFSTSSSAYAKQAALQMKTTEKEDGDVEGEFYVGAVSELGEGKLFWVTSSYFLDEMVNSMVSGANGDVFLNALNWMGHQEQAISIRAKSLDSEGLTLTAAESSRWSIMMIGVIPLSFVALGIIIWVRRKRR